LNLRAAKHVNRLVCRGIRPVHSFCGRMPWSSPCSSFPLARYRQLDRAQPNLPTACHPEPVQPHEAGPLAGSGRLACHVPPPD
jgi:hypothetical protein